MQNLGGHLVTLGSQREEEALVNSNILDDTYTGYWYWIGLMKVKSHVPYGLAPRVRVRMNFNGWMAHMVRTSTGQMGNRMIEAVHSMVRMLIIEVLLILFIVCFQGLLV